MTALLRKNRSWCKTATYSIMHIIVAIGVAYTLTGSWVVALSIGLLEPVVQTVFYHFHEMAWKKLD